jgi:hypothetical protein
MGRLLHDKVLLLGVQKVVPAQRHLLEGFAAIGCDVADITPAKAERVVFLPAFGRRGPDRPPFSRKERKGNKPWGSGGNDGSLCEISHVLVLLNADVFSSW